MIEVDPPHPNARGQAELASSVKHVLELLGTMVDESDDNYGELATAIDQCTRLEVAKPGYPNPLRGEEALEITKPTVLEIEWAQGRSQPVAIGIRWSMKALVIDGPLFPCEFGCGHLAAVSGVGGHNRSTLELVVWPKDFRFETAPADSGGSASNRHDWFVAAWAQGEFDAICRSFRPRQENDFIHDGGGGYYGCFERLFWLRWRSGNGLHLSDMQFVKHNRAKRLSQIGYRNKDEWADRLNESLRELEPSAGSHLAMVGRGRLELSSPPPEEIELMTNLLVETHNDMRRDRGLRIRPDRYRGESELSRLVRGYWPAAKREYSPDWLGSQRIDIAIPAVRLAMEYHGLQHFEPVEFFGGEEALERRRALDQLKEELCAQNGYRLIVWRYDETISAKALAKRCQEVGVELPDRGRGASPPD